MGSGPKGPMSCRTQWWISIRPENAYLRPKEQFSMIFNGTFAFSQFFVMLPCYSMGISNCFHFSSIFHVIQWEICIFLLFCKFAMLFNGKYAFYQLSMLFNGNLKLEKLRRGGTYGRMYGWTYGRTYGNSPLCPTGHRPFGAAALLSLQYFTWSLQAGYRVPLTMCDPWMTSFCLCVCLPVCLFLGLSLIQSLSLTSASTLVVSVYVSLNLCVSDCVSVIPAPLYISLISSMIFLCLAHLTTDKYMNDCFIYSSFILGRRQRGQVLRQVRAHLWLCTCI